MCLPWNILLVLCLKKVLPHRAEFSSDWSVKNADDASVSLLIGFTGSEKRILVIICHLVMEICKSQPEDAVVVDFPPLIHADE